MFHLLSYQRVDSYDNQECKGSSGYHNDDRATNPELPLIDGAHGFTPTCPPRNARDLLPTGLQHERTLERHAR